MNIDTIIFENYLEQLMLEDEIMIESISYPKRKSWKDKSKSEKASTILGITSLTLIIVSLIRLSTFYIQKGTNEKQKEYCKKSIIKAKQQLREVKEKKKNGEMTEQEYRKHLKSCKNWCANLEKIIKTDKATLRYHQHINKLMKLDEEASKALNN